MKRYLSIEDNEDGTCTMKIKLEPSEPESINILAMSFDDLISSWVQDPNMHEMAEEKYGGKVIEIPNSPESLGGE